jgi:hypothetical protein
MFDCGKCNGKGKIREFGHVHFGICFECEGTGKTTNRAKSTVSKESSDRIISAFSNIGEQERFFSAPEWEAIVAWVHRSYDAGVDAMIIRAKVSESCDRRVRAYWANN